MQTRFFYLVVILLFALVSAQNIEQKAILDAFTEESQVIVITTPPTGVTSPITETRINQGPSIIGEERDLQLTVERGSNAVFSSVVNLGEWNVNTPTASSGFALLQYDGKDNSLELSITTMNVNLRENGADRIRTLVKCDIPTIVRISVYEGAKECFIDQEVEGDETAIQEFFWNYSDFSGGCGFTNVNAIEIFIEAFDNVDIVFTFFGTFGPPSVTPPPPPPPPPPAVCTCSCPNFVCGVVFKGPSDDDDTIDDDTDDDEIVFRPVYYGPVDDDFDKIDGDDDDYEWITFRGGLSIDHQDDDDDLHDLPNWDLPTTFPDDDETAIVIIPDDLDVPSSSSLLSVSLVVIGTVFILF